MTLEQALLDVDHRCHNNQASVIRAAVSDMQKELDIYRKALNAVAYSNNGCVVWLGKDVVSCDIMVGIAEKAIADGKRCRRVDEYAWE